MSPYKITLPGLKMESTSRRGVPGFVEAAEAVEAAVAVADGRLELLLFFFFEAGGPRLASEP